MNPVTIAAAAAGAVTAAALATAQTTPDADRIAQLEHQLARTQAALTTRTRQVRRLRHQLRTTHAPNVNTAIRLASIVYDIPEAAMRRVAWCESRMNPLARNSSSDASGLFQFLPSTWRAYPIGRAGVSVWNPYANALQAAYIVKRDGGWRQWECKP